MKTVQFFILLGIVSAGLNAAPTQAESTAAGEASAQCNALQNTDFSKIPDAPTQITDVTVVKASDVIPEYCKVTGYVAPQVGIKLGLPVAWNGKFIEMGCGGHCGILNDARLSEFFEGCGPALRKGYACIITDMGHNGAVFDTVWAYDNLEGMIDWGYRATHVTALAGKAITRAYYQKPLLHSYFSGTSTGGRQALQATQRFPYDFDGIIAGAPPVRLADIYVTFAWGQRVSRDATGKPILSIADLRLLTNGALARCDLDDGVRDGIISSPFKCPFRASDLACKSGQTATCLTPEKVKAAEQIYEGPVDSHGKSLFGAGPLPGSELGGDAPWNEESGGNWGVSYVGTDKAPAAYSSLAQEGLRFLFFSPPLPRSWTIRDFDFDKDYKRLDVTQSLYDSSNPDLTRFKSAGGKMLIYQGLNDAVVLPGWTIRYYENVERVMGGSEKTQSFARLFLLPGSGHGPGGPGADIVDYLTYLEDWVEQGKAPDKLIAAHLKSIDGSHELTFPLEPASIAFTRPVYPYPVTAKYRGRGDPNDAANFEPLAR